MLNSWTQKKEATHPQQSAMPSAEMNSNEFVLLIPTVNDRPQQFGNNNGGSHFIGALVRTDAWRNNNFTGVYGEEVLIRPKEYLDIDIIQTKKVYFFYKDESIKCIGRVRNGLLLLTSKIFWEKH
ncbi:MAG: hypothetical protein DDT22_00839 [candidate division WS2 bacterium]|nr:hypothetical protein [Candidatus Lithacetigena glycinireducens]